MRQTATRRKFTFCTEQPRARKEYDVNSDPNPKINRILNLQIERELILSSDKASSKIPLMHEVRNTPSGPRRTAAALLPRQTGSIAPDHPPKQLQAWVSRISDVFCDD